MVKTNKELLEEIILKLDGIIDHFIGKIKAPDQQDIHEREIEIEDLIGMDEDEVEDLQAVHDETKFSEYRGHYARESEKAIMFEQEGMIAWVPKSAFEGRWITNPEAFQAITTRSWFDIEWKEDTYGGS